MPIEIVIESNRDDEIRERDRRKDLKSDYFSKVLSVDEKIRYGVRVVDEIKLYKIEYKDADSNAAKYKKKKNKMDDSSLNIKEKTVMKSLLKMDKSLENKLPVRNLMGTDGVVDEYDERVRTAELIADPIDHEKEQELRTVMANVRQLTYLGALSSRKDHPYQLVEQVRTSGISKKAICNHNNSYNLRLRHRVDVMRSR